MASINKRSGRSSKPWQARWREYPGGPQKTQHFARKIDSERFLDGIRGDLARGMYVDPKAGRVTFREYAEAWRAAQVHRENTRRSVEQHLRLHVYPVLGDRPLQSVRTTDVQALVKLLSEQLEPSTVRVVHGRIMAVFRAAVRDRLIAVTPCLDVKRPDVRASSMLEVLTTAEVLALAGAVPDRYWGTVIAGAGLGLRPGELFGLTVDRVDFLRRAVRVDRLLVYRPRSGLELAPLKDEGLLPRDPAAQLCR
jgi:integrase